MKAPSCIQGPNDDGRLPRDSVKSDWEVALGLKKYLAHEAPVRLHLADQLLLPMVSGGITGFLTCAPTSHFTSNADVMHAFTGRRIVVEPEGKAYAISVR